VRGLKGAILERCEKVPEILKRKAMLLFDFEQYPGGREMVSFFLVPIDGFTARIPGLMGGNAK